MLASSLATVPWAPPWKLREGPEASFLLHLGFVCPFSGPCCHRRAVWRACLFSRHRVLGATMEIVGLVVSFFASGLCASLFQPVLPQTGCEGCLPLPSPPCLGCCGIARGVWRYPFLHLVFICPFSGPCCRSRAVRRACFFPRHCALGATAEIARGSLLALLPQAGCEACLPLTSAPCL